MQVSLIAQRISTRLDSFTQSVWRWIGATPVTFKVIGLVLLPLFVLGIGGTLFIRQELIMLLQAHGAESIQAEIFMSLTQQTAFVFAVTALVGLGLAILFARVLTRPLKNVAQAMRNVKSGDLSIHVPVWARDEIGEVQDEFNLMVDDLRVSHEALLQKSQELEMLNHENTRLLGELNSKNTRLEQLLHHAITAQEAERKRLARELHDETGQSLTSILLRLKALQSETELDVIQDRLNGLRYLTAQTLEDVRRLSLDLRPMALDDLGLVPAIRWYVQQFSERNNIDVKLNVTGSNPRLPADFEIILYRAVQEGLTNIVRHARAHHATIKLERSGSSVWLTITDDGQGIQSGKNQTNGMGLEGMRERVMLVGGKLRLDSALGAGTQITIELPVGEMK
jgi:signal transduction histidine kinase